MTDTNFRGRSILVVEDEYFLAGELQTNLVEGGAIVVGPVGTVQDAMSTISDHHIDGAILDVNLGGEMAFPVADALLARGIPFVLTTGYDETIIPGRLADVVRCEKPVEVGRVARALFLSMKA